MVDSKRLLSVGKHLALFCATLLLLVTSVSNGHTKEVGRRLTTQVLRQAIVLGTQGLQRQSNAQTRASKLERSEAQSERTSLISGATATLASLHVWHLTIHRTYRVLSPYTLRTTELPNQRIGIDVERARAPPVTAVFIA
jgi:hypothetical protein